MLFVFSGWLHHPDFKSSIWGSRQQEKSSGSICWGLVCWQKGTVHPDILYKHIFSAFVWTTVTCISALYTNNWEECKPRVEPAAQSAGQGNWLDWERFVFALYSFVSPLKFLIGNTFDLFYSFHPCVKESSWLYLTGEHGGGKVVWPQRIWTF